MALKVADLFAELGLDARALDQGISQSTRRAETELRTMVATADKVGSDAGRELSAGIERGVAGLDVDGKVRAEIGDLPGLGDQVGTETGSALGAGILDGMPDVSGGVEGVLGDVLGDLPTAVGGPALAAGAALGAMVAAGISEALQAEQLDGMIEAQLGLDESAAQRLGDDVAGIYRQNFGDSMAQVGDAVVAVERQLGGLGESAKGDLDGVAEGVLTLANVFGEDLNMSVRAVAQLVRTGLAEDTTEALDLLTVGLQGPANGAEDLLEVFTEYSTQFRQLGLDGEDALGLMSQALDGGARDADIAADALKEFAIRAKDGSAQSAAAFEAIGLSAEDMALKIANGGPGAREALDATLDGIRSIEDPAERSRIAVALFGTQAEDMQGAFANFDLSTARGEIEEITGAMERAQGSFDDTLSSWEILKRNVMGGAGDAVNDWLDGLQLDDKLGDSSVTWGEVIGYGVKEGISHQIDPARGLRELIFGPEGVEKESGRIALEIGKNAGRVGEAADGSEPQVTAFAGSLKDAAEGGQLMADMLELSATRAATFLESIDTSSGLDDMLTSVLDFNEGLWDLGRNIENLSPGIDISDIADGITKPAEDTAAVLREVMEVGGDARQVIADVFEWQGADAAVARADELRQQFVEMYDAAGLTDEQIIELLETMGLLPDQVNTAITVSGTQEAMAELDLLQSWIEAQEYNIPEAIASEVERAIGEGRMADAANLLQTWLSDQQDGFYDNPLVMRILGDTEVAEEDVDRLERRILDMPGVSEPEKAKLLAELDAGNYYGTAALLDALARDRTVRIRTIAENVSGLIFGQRAEGGPVWPGGPFLVGEKGPELVEFGASGFVTPADRTADLLGGRSMVGSTPAMDWEGTGSAGAISSGLEAKLDRVADALERAGGGHNVTVNQQVHQADGVRATLREIRLAAEQGIALSENGRMQYTGRGSFSGVLG